MVRIQAHFDDLGYRTDYDKLNVRDVIDRRADKERPSDLTVFNFNGSESVFLDISYCQEGGIEKREWEKLERVGLKRTDMPKTKNTKPPVLITRGRRIGYLPAW